jgi:hypothetical protein
MSFLNIFWLDLLALALAMVLFNGALTGRFYSHGRGGPPKLIWTVKSAGLRLIFLLFALPLVVWLVLDLRHKLH